MKRERETNIQKYGKLIMRPYTIAGNLINAFYDASDDLVFVLDNTINVSKPNVLLVINPDGDRKWDEILSNDYGVDLEMVRPKQDNKYQKLDIEYSGLAVYDNLIRAYMADDDMEDYLEQLNVLRDSAARHSAVMRLNAANEVISKTNVTIVKTKESIANLQERLKTLRAKLTATRKEIGKVSTKQSAAKILRLESQIEATNEKLKRAKKRLESAQRRLEVATADAELASNLLNQPEADIIKSKSVIVAPKHEIKPVDEDEDEEESDIKPLFEEDPQILNEDIAFKPIEFTAPALNVSEEEKSVPVFKEETESKEKPIIETFEPVVAAEEEPVVESKPVLESMMPVEHEEVIEEKPVEQYVAPVVPITPVAPVEKEEPVVPVATPEETSTKPTFVYYVLLFVLILLSVFTLWLYQKNIKTSSPDLVAKTTQTVVKEEPVAKPVVQKPVEQVVVPASVTVEPENVFLDEEIGQDEEIIEILGDVPARVATSGEYEDEVFVQTEEDVIATKPVYEPAGNYDEPFYDEEEAEYQAEQNM